VHGQMLLSSWTMNGINMYPLDIVESNFFRTSLYFLFVFLFFLSLPADFLYYLSY